LNNFRIWLENNTKKRIEDVYRFRLSGNTTTAIEHWIIDPPYLNGDPQEMELSRWVRDGLTFLSGTSGASELEIRLYLRYLPLIKMFLDELRSYLVREKSKGIARIFDTIRLPYIRLATLNDIALAADPKWQLVNAIHNDDINKWLVYADYIEEMGDQKNSHVIRRMLS
jgi:hypothetical protein